MTMEEKYKFNPLTSEIEEVVVYGSVGNLVNTGHSYKNGDNFYDTYEEAVQFAVKKHTENIELQTNRINFCNESIKNSQDAILKLTSGDAK